MFLRALFILVCLGFIQAKLLKLSCKEIRQFVDGHNSRRLQLAKGSVPNQPAASQMLSVVWDKELATKAARWASNNMFKHNPNKKVPSGKFEAVGENIYYYSTTDRSHVFTPESSMASWFDEHYLYTYGELKPSDFAKSKPIGHYTQMVWSNSTHIGCGVSQYAQNGYTKFLVVCNYGPAGNYLDQTPYPAGRPAGHLTCGVKDCHRPYGTC